MPSSAHHQMQVDGEGKEGTPGPNAGGVGHITTEEAAMGTQVVVRGMRPIDAALSCCMCLDLPDVWPPPPRPEQLSRPTRDLPLGFIFTTAACRTVNDSPRRAGF